MRPNIILLDAFKQRLEFPELKKVALEHYRAWDAPDSPVSLIVVKKASGDPLIYELRAMGIPVQEFTPHRGTGDKTARLNSVADIIQSGLVWVPETRWAEEVVEEIAGFPFAQNDDLVDSTVMALMRFRSGGFIRLPDDEPDEVTYFRSKRYSGGSRYY
jgi:predicted phage terminase large subunit-like protein